MFVNFVDCSLCPHMTPSNTIYNGHYDRVPNIGEKVRINKTYYNVTDVLSDVKSHGDEKEEEDNFQPSPVWYWVSLKEGY